MSPDEVALTARFREGFDTSSKQVLTLNKPSTSVDRSKPWCRYTVSPYERRRVENGVAPRYLELGSVFLQVFTPKAVGLSSGDELVSRFQNLMTDWRSGDGAVQVGRMTRTLSEEADHYQVTIRYSYQSLRTH